MNTTVFQLIHTGSLKRGKLTREHLDKMTWLHGLTIKAGNKNLWTDADLWLVSSSLSGVVGTSEMHF